jgi:hypothetical protein
MKDKILRIEILHYSKDPFTTLEVTKKMLTNRLDLRMGLVDCVNIYNRTIKNAPLYGNPPKAFIFKQFKN